MAQLREDKKREILEFLESKAEEGDVLPLELENIKKRLADDVFDEETVKELIDELEDEGLVIKKIAKMEMIYPKEHQESIEERLSHLFIASDVFGYYAIGALSYLFLLNWQPFFEVIHQNGLEPKEMIFRYALSGIIGGYLIGRVVVDGYNRAQENISVLREYRYLIYPTVVIAAVSGLIIWSFSVKSEQPVTTTHIVTIVTVSIGAGVPIGEFILKKKEKFD